MVMSKEQALLEIGTEEIPAKLAGDIQNDLENIAQKLLEENRIKVASLSAFVAPRDLFYFLLKWSNIRLKWFRKLKVLPKILLLINRVTPQKQLLDLPVIRFICGRIGDT